MPKTHDIARLLELAGARDPGLTADLEKAADLTPYGVEYRYPGDHPEVSSVSSVEAARCVETATAVGEAILGRLPTDLVE